MKNINNKIINQLALQFNKGNTGAITELVEALKGFIKLEAGKAVYKAEGYKIQIPAEDFESVFCQAIWEAAKDFNGSSHFIQRLRIFMKRREADVWRQYRTIKDGEINYIKARLTSLDAEINEERDTIGDIILTKHASPSHEEEIVGLNIICNAINDFARVNAKFAAIIEMLSMEATQEDIANFLGEAQYDGKCRSVVCRARKAFQRFLVQQYDYID